MKQVTKPKFGWVSRILALSLLAWLGSAQAASFDCGKARRPLEKFICASPELDAADTRLGEVYRQVQAGFPLKGFLPVTQRMFLAGYSSCMMDDRGRTSTGPEALKRCVAMVKQRTLELQTQATARVYSNDAEKFSHEGLAILVYSAEGQQRIRLWGNWMPDANNPKPFPEGVVCDLDGALKADKDGFKSEATDDALLKINDKQLSISEHIMCTPRNGIGEGNYRRVR